MTRVFLWHIFYVDTLTIYIEKILFVKKNSLNHNVVVLSQLLFLLQKHSFPNHAHKVNNNIKYYQIVLVYH